MKRSSFVATTAAAFASAAGPARAAVDEVSIISVKSTADAPFVIADRKGWFREVGIAVSFRSAASGAQMIAPLGAGQVDVGGGAPAAGLYNAIERGIGLKIVADRGTDTPGYGFNPIVVRTELVTSGRYKGPADAKGLRFAEPAKGSTTASLIQHFLAKGALSYHDVQHVFLSFPDQVAAFRNGSIDAAIANEPWGTLMERAGVARIVEPDDRFYPNHQISVVFYSRDFIRRRPDLARRFMLAYLRGVWYYKDALRGGHFAGPNAADVMAMLADDTKVDMATLR